MSWSPSSTYEWSKSRSNWWWMRLNCRIGMRWTFARRICGSNHRSRSWSSCSLMLYSPSATALRKKKHRFSKLSLSITTRCRLTCCHLGVRVISGTNRIGWRSTLNKIILISKDCTVIRSLACKRWRRSSMLCSTNGQRLSSRMRLLPSCICIKCLHRQLLAHSKNLLIILLTINLTTMNSLTIWRKST